MKRKIGAYRKYFCIGWLCLLMFGCKPHGACKIEDLLYAAGEVGAKSLADGCQWE